MHAEELCRLLRDADRRYATFSGEFAVRFYPEIGAKAERQQLAAGEITMVGLDAEEYFGDLDRGELAGKITESRALVWVKRPACYREQDFDEDDPQLLVRNETRWWCRDGADRVSSGSSADGEQPAAAIGRYEMCVTPEPLATRLDFEVLGTGERTHRKVVRAQARRLQPAPLLWAARASIVGIDLNRWFNLPVFSNGGDAYTVEIDAATGVILRIASIFENQDWMVIEAVRAGFDEPVPEGTFTIPQDQPAEGAAKSRH